MRHTDCLFEKKCKKESKQTTCKINKIKCRILEKKTVSKIKDD